MLRAASDLLFLEHGVLKKALDFRSRAFLVFLSEVGWGPFIGGVV